MRPVIWRLGAIANSGHPDALELIRKILLASASIPAMFAPVLIPVEVDGKQYDELHVDGGAASQMFLYPVGIDYDEVLERLAVPGRPKVYVIRNSRLAPMYKHIPNRLIPIAGRSLQSLVRTQGIGDLYRMYMQTCRDGLDFNLAYIPAEFRQSCSTWPTNEAKRATTGKKCRPSSRKPRSTAGELVASCPCSPDR
jgi:hypothetical protein